MCTFNVRTLAFDGKNGIGHSEVILKLCQELGCDVIGLQETRRDGRSAFTAAGYTVFCSGADGSKCERKGTHGVGLAVRVYRGRGGKRRSRGVVHQRQTDESSHPTRRQIK